MTITALTRFSMNTYQHMANLFHWTHMNMFKCLLMILSRKKTHVFSHTSWKRLTPKSSWLTHGIHRICHWVFTPMAAEALRASWGNWEHSPASISVNGTPFRFFCTRNSATENHEILGGVWFETYICKMLVWCMIFFLHIDISTFDVRFIRKLRHAMEMTMKGSTAELVWPESSKQCQD